MSSETMSDDFELDLETIIPHSDKYGVRNPDAPRTEYIITDVGIDLKLMV